jgi:hypothetical protein
MMISLEGLLKEEIFKLQPNESIDTQYEMNEAGYRFKIHIFLIS